MLCFLKGTSNQIAGNNCNVNDRFTQQMDCFREIGQREFSLPSWVPSKAAMRANEIWHRDAPRAVINGKRIVKKVIGRK
jgi:hypothetical protein